MKHIKIFALNYFIIFKQQILKCFPTFTNVFSFFFYSMSYLLKLALMSKTECHLGEL